MINLETRLERNRKKRRASQSIKIGITCALLILALSLIVVDKSRANYLMDEETKLISIEQGEGFININFLGKERKIKFLR